MLRPAIGGALLVLVSTGSSIALAACRTQGHSFLPSQNDKVTYTTVMNAAGCRHTYRANGTFMFEKAVAMKSPKNGTLTQVGEFTFFYKPKPGFSGKDSYVIYVCGSGKGGAGCSRLTYEATVE